MLGDSLVDDGNNDALARADYYPYGVDFPPLGAATGRFCNGKTVADALCQWPATCVVSIRLFNSAGLQPIRSVVSFLPFQAIFWASSTHRRTRAPAA